MGARKPGPIFPCAAALVLAVNGATAALAAARPPANDLQLVSAQVGERVAPGGSLSVKITVRNTGSATWEAGAVELGFTGEGTWTGANLALTKRTRPKETATFAGTLGASTRIGRYALSWQARAGTSSFGPAIAARTEITCSDGLFCNGDERYVNGRCVAGPAACNDGATCTTDICDEAERACLHTGAGLSPDCPTCAAKNCNPTCHNRQCGDDGCGGSCGSCAAGQACIDSQCVFATQPGTCAGAVDLGTINPAAGSPITMTLTGDTSTGLNETVPLCNNISAAPEFTYTFAVTTTVGIDAQSSGYDTVLHLRGGDCQASDATVACNDDAAPPGNFGSHIFALLQPGTYYLMVDGFTASSSGPYQLDVKFALSCLPQCDGRFCGDDGCGGSCAPGCEAGQVCSAIGRCRADPCTPACGGRQCGDDGCGGSCGTCQAGKACDEVSGACHNVPVCDNDKPVCKVACSSQEYCGTDCECHRSRDPRPDLIINKARLASEIVFDTLNVSSASCTLVEQCVGGTGLRNLMRFAVEAVNQGQATMNMPPQKLRPDLFEWSPCHGHYHFNGFATFRLLRPDGTLVIEGGKRAYCMEDTLQVHQGPTIGCDKKYDCFNQGIQAGWSDVYTNNLDCQWLDITGIPGGDYLLQVEVNPGRAFEEADFGNNVATIPVKLP
jgi:hypothetical protein